MPQTKSRTPSLNMPRPAPEILDASDPADAERWTLLAADSPSEDVYYSPVYVSASAKIEPSAPIAFIGGPEHCRFLAPLLVRRLSAPVDGRKCDWTDICSPYGYGGLLPLSTSKPSAEDLHCFLAELHDWCHDRDAACCLLRLHPLNNQDEWFGQESLGPFQIRPRGTTTAIDLTNWNDLSDCPLGLPKDRRWELNRASRILQVTRGTGEDANMGSSIRRFIGLYEETMNRRSADRFYRFPFAYFSRLVTLGSRFCLMFAWLDNQLAAAALFLAGRDYAHYHLAASNETGLKWGAATLLIAEGARWARAQGCRLLHLGGGLNPGDTLESFKRSFDAPLYRYAYLVGVTDQQQFEAVRRSSQAPWPYRED